MFHGPLAPTRTAEAERRRQEQGHQQRKHGCTLSEVLEWVKNKEDDSLCGEEEASRQVWRESVVRRHIEREVLMSGNNEAGTSLSCVMKKDA